MSSIADCIAGSNELGAVEWAACSAVLAGSGAFGGRGQRLGGGLEVAGGARVIARGGAAWQCSGKAGSQSAPWRYSWRRISACEKGEEPERALRFLEAMQQQDVAPRLITYSALISACKRGK